METQGEGVSPLIKVEKKERQRHRNSYEIYLVMLNIASNPNGAKKNKNNV